MKDKNLSLKNIIANQALEGQHMTQAEIARVKAVIDGRISTDEATEEIHNALKLEKISLEKKMFQP